MEKYHKTENPEKRDEIDLDPFVVFHKAIENGRPRMHLQKVVRGGQSLQVGKYMYIEIEIVHVLKSFTGVSWLVHSVGLVVNFHSKHKNSLTVA